MITPYLILHKVRGEPAFDIAHHQPCPECASEGCNECDGLGHWWIVSTSGHRAYPYWHLPMPFCYHDNEGFLALGQTIYRGIPTTMPADWPDHYPSPSSTPKGFVSALLDKLGLVTKIERRF